MIDLHSFWKGRDVQYADQLTDEIKANADLTVGRVNELLEVAGFKSITAVNSGWRPKAVNDKTSNAGANSNHLTGKAVDIGDPDRTLATWCADNVGALETVGLWCEDFRWTPDWVHFQTVPPKSGRRIYIPSSAPAPDPDFPVTWA